MCFLIVKKQQWLLQNNIVMIALHRYIYLSREKKYMDHFVTVFSHHHEDDYDYTYVLLSLHDVVVHSKKKKYHHNNKKVAVITTTAMMMMGYCYKYVTYVHISVCIVHWSRVYSSFAMLHFASFVLGNCKKMERNNFGISIPGMLEKYDVMQ